MIRFTGSCLDAMALFAFQASMPSCDPLAFHLFPKLPTELRHFIWRLAIPGARIINIKQSIGRSYDGVCEFCHKKMGCNIGRYGLPVDSEPVSEPLLSVCQESRYVTMDIYSTGPLLTVSSASDLCDARRPGKFLYKPEIDVVYFQSDGGFLNSHPASAFICTTDESFTTYTIQVLNAQRIALDYPIYGYFIKQLERTIKRQAQEKFSMKPLFPDLKEMAIIVRKEGFEVRTYPKEGLNDFEKLLPGMKHPDLAEMTRNILDAWCQRVVVKGYIKETKF